jgi:phenylpropionate dioxygenase-like ring-hydroxylating dioxygenase large terminal subunit
MKFQYNAWYVAALPSQINRELIRRTILSEPVLLFRRARMELPLQLKTAVPIGSLH